MSIVYQYENTTLQFGDESGNIGHSGVLASNISGTPALSDTLPTTNTGTSLGHYHYTDPTTNALQFLNASGSGVGGHYFYSSNDTNAPIQTARIDTDGITIDRSTGGGGSVIYSPNVYALDGNGVTIEFPPGTDLTAPPYSFAQTFNPVYITQTTAYYTTGELAYLVVSSIETCIIFTNDNNTNPIPPNFTPTGFPTGKPNVGVTLGIPLFALSPPAPVITKTVNLLESLTIVDDTNISTMSATSLVIDDGSDNTTSLDCASVLIQDQNGSTVLVQPNYVAIENGPTVQSTYITDTSLTVADNVNNSVLTSTSLTFNNINVQMNQVTPTLIYSSPLIYADGHEPATSNSIKNTYGYTGWYYRNSAPNVAPTNKINWYFPPQTPTTTPVSALKGISISFFNGITTSNDDTLFITVLTVPTGSGDYAPGFFHSSMTYVFNQTITPVAHTNYQGVCIIDKSSVPFNYETQIQYEPSTVNNPRGTYAPTDNILSVVIGTNSASATGNVQLVVNKLNLHYYDFTQSYLLVPP